MTVNPTRDPLPDAIVARAARWLSEGFDGAASPEHQAALAAWLADDPRHARAFAEMQDVWALMGAFTETQMKTRRPRYRRWIPSLIAASMAFILLGAAFDWPTKMRAEAMTSTGERRSIALPDGSRVQLDTASAVALDFTAERRVVRLLKGNALFDVAADPERPFTVEAGGGTTTALGTQFMVRRHGETTSVVVVEHSVRVAVLDGMKPSATVGEGRAVTYDAEAGVGDVKAVSAADAVAWTDGALVFNNAPVSQVAAEIGRYHPGVVQVLGKAQSMRVSGVFRIDDPVAALDRLQRALGLHSARLTDRLIFIFA